VARLAVIATVVLAFAAPAVSASPRPPVIVERFTPLPCPAKPQTTLEYEGCAEHRILRTDAAINARVEAIFVLLKRVRSAAAQSNFVRGERAWLVYRQAVCKSRADLYEGGTAAGLAAATCTANANDAHLRDLRTFARDLRR
jgi:uncharacterized protein YecT (DUF1311 family)